VPSLLAPALLQEIGTGRSEGQFLWWNLAMALKKSHPINDNEPLGIEVGIVEIRNAAGEWLVEAIDHGSEGEIYRAIFAGPMAEERARAYARLTYGTPSAPTQSSTST
jgi:hypothetical protein